MIERLIMLPVVAIVLGLIFGSIFYWLKLFGAETWEDYFLWATLLAFLAALANIDEGLEKPKDK